MTTQKIIAFVAAGSCSLGLAGHPAQAKPVKKAAAKASAKSGVLSTRVVPGASIGRVSLGEAQGTIRRRLGAPSVSFKLNNGLNSDLWRAASARRWDGQKHTFEVVYHRGVAIQIEATNPIFTTARGLGLRSDDPA